MSPASTKQGGHADSLAPGSRESFAGQLPATYGKYELLERIGAGGMAEVYRAKLPGVMGFEKICVIKRILPHLVQQKAIGEMFIEEAKLAARVQHRNVVQVYDLGALDNGELYIAMEYVAGTDLSVLLRNSVKRKLRIPMWFTLHVLSEMLAGLTCVHELLDDQGRPLGVVHRDVTPSNIFISYGGDIKLGDFGVAQSSRKTTDSRVGEIKGKIAYMAPEQVRGAPVDGRADVFAAGVVLWECLTQRRLFGGRAEQETIQAILSGARVPPSKYDPAIPPELDELVLRAVDPEPDLRVQTAAELQAAVAEILPRFAPRVLQADVRHVVEVLLGQVSPDSAPRGLGGPARDDKPKPSGLLSPSSITATKSFGESTPGTRPRPYHLPPGAKSIPPPPPAQDAYVKQGTDFRRPGGSLPEAAIDPQVPKFDTGDIEGVISLGEDEDEIDVDVDMDGLDAPIGRSSLRPGPPTGDIPPWVGPPPKRNAEGAIKRDGGYRGPHPFWLQNEQEMIWGPCDFSVIRSYLAKADRLTQGLRVAAYQTPWVDLDTFAALSGQEALRILEPMTPRGFFNGSLGIRSLPSVLGALAASRSTGRLVIEGEDPERPPRREIHLKDGVPIYVATDAPQLQLPDLLARRGMLTPELTPKMMHEVLYRLEPLEVVSARHMQVDVEKSYGHVMRERALEIFYWRSGLYSFEHDFIPARGQPITKTLLQLVAYCVGRTRSEQELKESVAPWAAQKLVPTDRLTQGVKDLGLGEEQMPLAKALWQGTPLRALLAKGGEPRVTLLLAYVMVEAGLLAPAVA